MGQVSSGSGGCRLTLLGGLVDTLQQLIDRDIESVRDTYQCVEARPTFSSLQEAHSSTAQAGSMSQLFLAYTSIEAQFFDSVR